MRLLRRFNPIHLTSFMLALAYLGWQPAAAQSDLAFEPYSVFVAQEEVFARCGPSDEYYRTDPLRHGQSLDVYAETDDGWLGIRPPEDSFCWIPAETVEMESNETGTVIEDRTVAWIGTHLGRARTYRWQVQLAKGEPVTVVGRSEREGPDGPQLWYRIVPPSGEFRWVHRDQVVTSSEELVASRAPREPETVPPSANNDRLAAEPATSTPDREATAAPESFRRDSAETKVIASSGTSILNPQQTTGSGLNENWRSNDARTAVDTEPAIAGGVATSQAPSRTVSEAMQRGGLLASVEFLSRPRLLDIGAGPSAPNGNESASDANWVSGAGRSAAAQQNRQQTQGLTPLATSGLPSVASPSPIMQASGIQTNGAPSTRLPAVTRALNTRMVVSAERIAQIEAEVRGAGFERLSLIFSRLMAAQATAAETEPIERAARNLASSSIDIVVAGRARELAQRAQRYRRVAQHRDGETVIQSTGLSVPVSPSLPSAVGGTPATSAVYAEGGAETATQTGYLVQVYSARSSSPPFALTDNTGRTVAYVTPSPGVNLRIHLNSKVQVVGSSGFLTGLNTPHILATQATRTPE